MSDVTYRLRNGILIRSIGISGVTIAVGLVEGDPGSRPSNFRPWPEGTIHLLAANGSRDPMAWRGGVFGPGYDVVSRDPPAIGVDDDGIPLLTMSAAT